MKHTFGRCAPALISLFATSLALAQGGAGTQWRVTTSMTGMGINLPGHSMLICATGDQQSRPPPPQQQGNCSYSVVSHVGNTVKYAVRCTGDEAMQGEGQITYGSDSYQGKFHLKTSAGAMNMSMHGQKLGACTGKEINGAQHLEAVKAREAKVLADEKAAEQASKAQIAQKCMAEAAKADSPFPFYDAFHAGVIECSSPDMKRAYCAGFQHEQPFLHQLREENQNRKDGATQSPISQPFTASLQLCGLQADTVRKSLCGKADADGQLDFLQDQCPAQVKTVAARECAGRSYSSVSDRYRDFCARNAPAARSTATQEVKSALKSHAGSLLRGLLGH